MIEVFKMILDMDKVNLGKLFCIDGMKEQENQKVYKLKYWIKLLY